MKQQIKYFLFLVLKSIFGKRSIRDWPSILGDLLEIKIPANASSNPFPSPKGGANINIFLDLVDRVQDIPGELAECGVFRGATAIPAALYLRSIQSNKTVHGFDSFEGFDEDVLYDVSMGSVDATKKVGGFSETSVRFVMDRAKLAGANKNLVLYPGYFKDTLSKQDDKTFCFVHLDCDTYSAYKECLEHFYPRINKGGIILFDEYRDPPWPGCDKAVDEFLEDKPEDLQLIERNNHQKYYFQKL